MKRAPRKLGMAGSRARPPWREPNRPSNGAGAWPRRHATCCAPSCGAQPQGISVTWHHSTQRGAAQQWHSQKVMMSCCAERPACRLPTCGTSTVRRLPSCSKGTSKPSTVQACGCKGSRAVVNKQAAGRRGRLSALRLRTAAPGSICGGWGVPTAPFHRLLVPVPSPPPTSGLWLL